MAMSFFDMLSEPEVRKEVTAYKDNITDTDEKEIDTDGDDNVDDIGGDNDGGSNTDI